jgi:multidrug efflux system outer membrane protein
LWELDLFGRVRRANEAARADVAATEANRRDLLVSLISEVARNYFELRGAQNELAVAQRNAENQRETKDMTESKVRAGMTTELDAARARAQLNSTLATIPRIEAALRRSIHRLSVLTGRQPDALQAELTEAKPLPALPALVSISDPTELLRRRPDIRTAERLLAASTARIGVQTADFFPRVTFHGSIGVQADSFSGLTDSGADRYSFGPRISWAALDIGHVRSRIKAAGARAEAALANFERTVLLALEETENALVDFSQEQRRRDYLVAAARDNEQAVALARERYQGGVADFLQVLDSQRSLLVIQDQLAASETRTATALVAVYKALGDGWQVEAAKAE